MSPKPWTEEMKVRLRERKAEARKAVDYSATGDPVRLDPPITVGPDPLLELLKAGQR